MKTETETIKAAKKPHTCSWCGQRIEAGESYKRYRWFGDDGASVVKEHPECYDAMMELSHLECDVVEFTPGDNPRGCNCGHDAGCQRCKSVEKEGAA